MISAMSQIPTFQQQLEQKRKAVAAAKKALEKAKKNLESGEAELRGWEEAALAITGAVPPTPLTPSRAPEPGNRGLSEKWKGVITVMALGYPRQFDLDDIAQIAAQYDLKPTADTLRGQMHHYSTESRYLERVGKGVFRATADGAAAAGVALGSATAGVATDDDEEIPF